MTQKELADKAGLPQPNLSNIEKGKQDITVTTLRKIAYALGMRPAEFFEEEEKMARLSRPEIERLAKNIAAGKSPSSEKEKRIADLFSDILPGKTKGKVRIHKIHQSWMELRKQLHPEEITALYQRVQEMKRP